MKTKMLLIGVVGCFLLAAGYQQQEKFDPEKERALILKNWDETAQAFKEGDIEKLESIFPYPEETILVNEGTVVKFTRERRHNNNVQAFQLFDVQEFAIVEEPIINFSKDGSMAWMVASFKVKVSIKDQEMVDAMLKLLPPEERKKIEQQLTKKEIVLATLDVMEKRDGKWQTIATAQTEKEIAEELSPKSLL